MFFFIVVGVDAGGAGSRGVYQTDPETAVLCLAHLQPRGHQNIPSHGAGQFSLFLLLLWAKQKTVGCETKTMS